MSTENCHGLETSSKLQQFHLIPESQFNKETITGKRDTTLEEYSTGAPGDADEIPKTNPHEPIDPKELSEKIDPHHKITESALEVAKVANATFKYFGRGLTFAVLAIEACRLGSSIHDDIKIRENAPEILKEIDEILECLLKKKEETSDKQEQLEISELILYYTGLKKQVKLIENRVPCRTIKTGASIGGAWLTGAAGATGGGWAGFHAGAVLGTFFGPVGTAVGGIVGGIIGSVSVGVASGIAGGHVAGTAAEWGLEKTHDVLYSD